VSDAPALRAAIPVTLVRRRNGYLSRAAQTLLPGGAPGRRARGTPGSLRAPAPRRPRAAQWRSPTGV